MKWVVVKKGDKYKRRLEFEVEDWVCLIIIVGVACLMLLGAIMRGI